MPHQKGFFFTRLLLVDHLETKPKHLLPATGGYHHDTDILTSAKCKDILNFSTDVAQMWGLKTELKI